MPFKSKAQQRFMFSKHPEMAKEFADATPDFAALPEHVKHYAEGGEVDDQAVNDYITKQFSPSAPEVPSVPFDVASMGPNLDTTLKTPAVAPAPVNPQDIPPAAEPLAPKDILPATPTGAPAEKPEAGSIGEKIVPSHPGLTADEIKTYLDQQRGQIDKYGPDAEAAVMDDIRKKMHGGLNTAAHGMAGMSDAIMQGVARAGSGQAEARLNEREENEARNRLTAAQHEGTLNLETLKAKEGLDQMDPNSGLGRAMLSTWGPLMDKLGIPKDKQATMMPALLSSVVPEGVKEKDAMARLAMMKDQRGIQLGMRQDQFDQGQWVKLGNAVNALTAGSRKALGIAATNNMRADRAIETIDNPKLVKSPQLVTQLVQDVSGIYKGGVPDEVSLKHSMYPNLMGDLAKLQSYLSSQPESGATKALLNQVREQVLSLKQIDNQAIEKNLGISAVEFEPIIKKDPARWQRMTGAVQAIERGPESKANAGNSGEMSNAPVISSQAEYDALPKGAAYIDPAGKHKIKG